MTILKRITTGLACSTAALMLATFPQQAAAVSSSVTVSTTATITYNIGSTTQPTINALANFNVDKKVDVLIENLDLAAVSISPGQTAVVLAFRVTNEGNDTQDILITDTALAGGAAAYGGSDNFDITSVALYEDSANTTWDGTTTETNITSTKKLVGVTAGSVRYIYLVGNVPSGQADNSIASYFMKATIYQNGVNSAEVATGDGVADSEDATDIVFADSTGANGDAARDGAHTIQGEWTVSAATLAVSKNSAVIDDYVSASNFKRIPGALIEYTIVINNSGAADAVSLSIADPVDVTNLTFQTTPYNTNTMAVKITKDVGGAPIVSYVDAATAWSSPNLNVSVGTIAAGTITHVQFQVVIK